MLLSFNDSEALKTAYVRCARAYREADALLPAGCYSWRHPRAAVGILEGYNQEDEFHNELSKQSGLPVWLFSVERLLMQTAPIGELARFTEDLLEAVPVGLNLNRALFRFFAEIILDERHGTINLLQDRETRYFMDAFAHGALGSYCDDVPPSAETWNLWLARAQEVGDGTDHDGDAHSFAMIVLRYMAEVIGHDVSKEEEPLRIELRPDEDPDGIEFFDAGERVALAIAHALYAWKVAAGDGDGEMAEPALAMHYARILIRCMNPARWSSWGLGRLVPEAS